MLIIYYLIYGIMFGFLSTVLVKEKNRDQFSWFLIGFFFGLFGFIAAAIVNKVDGESHPDPAPENVFVQVASVFDPSSRAKTCPDCAEAIKLGARVCRFCNYRFSEEEVIDGVRSAHWNWMTGADASINGIGYCNFCGAQTDKNFGIPPFIVCKECSA
ncbi:MAG: hypothetical protein O3A65_08735 [Proteobacteria bacterium]|nr:hypothetical protein [Pseudomonadota bacterium]